MLTNLLAISQILLSVAIGFSVFANLQSKKAGENAMKKESVRMLEKLHRMRRIQLTVPLSEKTRPASFAEIRGQNDSLMALRAALCGPNPQHVILYGPPGVGKTAAARAALYEAIKDANSPFREGAKFIEMDATILHFDERGIADPLIGSVHDPIYQGAGAYGPAGIPQPKEGAVTKAHGGILFIDEIGEMHPVELNKLLKVLEDRRVFLESAYYSRDNKEIPRHIHDIFQNGLPADFRLVGATTRMPEELPPALRSRCAEVFFSPLSGETLTDIAKDAILKSGFSAAPETASVAASYAENGRDVVNMLQTAIGYAQTEGRCTLSKGDIDWVARIGHYMPRSTVQCHGEARIGVVRGLAVQGHYGGFVPDIEAVADYERGRGILTLTGAIEEEITNVGTRRLMRTGMAKASVQNALRALEACAGIRAADWKLHVNFPGGYPADGPSAGIAVFAALYSAVFKIPIKDTVALTGELSPRGAVLPVGGVPQKLEAAEKAGIKTVFLPTENVPTKSNLHIMPVASAGDLVHLLFFANTKKEAARSGDIHAPTALPASFSPE